MSEFLGLPDDIARLAIQRLLQCDVRARSHRSAARAWQRSAIILSGASAVASALAAWAVAKNFATAAIVLSLLAAILAAAQSALAANDKTERHRSAANGYELLANELDRYLNLEVGPPMWKGIIDNLENLPSTLASIEGKIDHTASRAPTVAVSHEAIRKTIARGEGIVAYLQMENVSVPPHEIWAD